MTRMFGHFMEPENGAPRATWAVGITKLEKDPGGDVIRDHLWNKLTKMARFRSRLVVSRFGGHFEELSQEELLALRDSGYLWSEVLRDGNATQQDIDDLVGKTDSWEYNRHAPLWRAQYVRNMKDGSAVIISTINHAIGDGVSLIAVTLSLADDTQDKSDQTKARRPTTSGKRTQGPKLGPVTRVRTFGYGVFQGLAASTWKPDPKNALALDDPTKPSKNKRVIQCAKIPLDEFKAIKQRFPGATLNDVMMALMTATLRAFFEEKNDPCIKPGGKVRGAFPINLRKPHDVRVAPRPAGADALGAAGFEKRRPCQHLDVGLVPLLLAGPSAVGLTPPLVGGLYAGMACSGSILATRPMWTWCGGSSARWTRSKSPPPRPSSTGWCRS
jgi:hypothetical protein